MFQAVLDPITFVTANGETDAAEFITLSVDVLGDCVDPYILADAPAVLSLGLRCVSFGYNFVWLGDETPAFITPGGLYLVLLEVHQTIPYLNEDCSGTFNINDGVATDIDEPLRRAGLCRWYGKIALDIECEVPLGKPKRAKAKAMAKAMPAAFKPPVEDDDEALLTDLLPSGAASSDDPGGSVEAPAAIIGGGGINNGAGVLGLRTRRTRRRLRR